MKAEIAKVPKRNITKIDKQAGIINNGADNCYPQRMERIINSSVTAKSAAKMYANFLVGQGFSDPEVNKIIVGKNLYKNITMYDLLEKVAHSLAYQFGATTKLRYNANFQIDEVDFTHYKNFRFGLPDDQEFSGKAIYYNNWDRTKGRIDRTKFVTFDIFNPDLNAIKYQIAKGAKELKLKDDFELWLRKWKGQIAFLFLDDNYVYPLSPIDVAQDDADTEYQIAMFKNGELSRNFFAKYFLKHAKFEDDKTKEIFKDAISEFTGAENNGSIMVIQGDITTDSNNAIIDNTFKLEKIDQNINDKLFIEWEKSISNNIRKAFGAIPPVLIDYVEGSLGNTSGEQLVQAAKFYNAMTKKDRTMISNYFKSIFANFKTPIQSDFSILPLNFQENEQQITM